MEENSLYTQAFDHQDLSAVISDLSLNLLSERFSAIVKTDIDREKLKKAVWLASVLSTSEDNLHQKRAQLFASLLFLAFQDDIEVLKSCYVLFSRLGNLTGTKFLANLYIDSQQTPVNLQSKYAFNDVLNQELLSQRARHIINTYKNSFLVTEFQKALWTNLGSENNLAISAPTSSGKSFIIKQFLINKFHETGPFKALYIVPSKALINQVSEEFYLEIDEQTHIKTSFLEEAEKFEKELYILTPERCIKLLGSGIPITFIFADEIQGVEDLSGRGLVFEYVYNELPLAFPEAKIITAGPNIKLPEATFVEIFEKPCAKVATAASPVFQLKVILKLAEHYNFAVEVISDRGKSRKFIQNFGFSSVSVSTEGTAVANLIHKIAPDDINIVYTKGGALAENWALKYSLIAPQLEVQDPEINDLISFLKEDIHRDYYLAKCLHHGVAYHHGSLPDLVRKEIEELFAKEKIQTIFCTSTLLEGVNLPANNLFTLQPKKDKYDLSKFEFGNLIGRAGRLNASLYGTIYYIERAKDDIAALEYFTSDYNKQITTFSTAALNYLDIGELSMEVNDIQKQDAESTSRARQINVFLKHKFIKGEEVLMNYLQKQDFTEDRLTQIISTLNERMSSLTVSKKVLVNNPSIDPLLQDRLYKTIINGDIREWVINKNATYNDYLSFAEVDKIPHHLRPFYLQFVGIVEKLDAIFQIVEECKVKYHRWISPRSMCLQAKRWLYGDPIGKIISSNIAYLEKKNRLDTSQLDEVNRVINETIKYNSTVTTHLLPKYFKILIDVLESILTDGQKEEYKLTLSLATMLELGTQEPAVIRLISAGISRNVALNIFDLYKKKVPSLQRENVDILNWLTAQHEVEGLKPIYNRYLKRLKLL